MQSSSKVHAYKPTAFYYRLALRGARSAERVLVIAGKLSWELDRLRDWSRARGLVPPEMKMLLTVHSAPDNRSETSEQDELIEMGLGLVREIERHKEWIRAHGMIPPKWYVTRQERRAKRNGRTGAGLVSVSPSQSIALGSERAE